MNHFRLFKQLIFSYLPFRWRSYLDEEGTKLIFGQKKLWDSLDSQNMATSQNRWYNAFVWNYTYTRKIMYFYMLARKKIPTDSKFMKWMQLNLDFRLLSKHISNSRTTEEKMNNYRLNRITIVAKNRRWKAALYLPVTAAATGRCPCEPSFQQGALIKKHC